MLACGSSLDEFFGKRLGIGPLTSAGLGNTISDVVGIVSGRYVEMSLYRMLPLDNTTKLEVWQNTLAEAVGITLGCLIGLLPLVFFRGIQ